MTFTTSQSSETGKWWFCVFAADDSPLIVSPASYNTETSAHIAACAQIDALIRIYARRVA
jgi:hypothetical protein